MSEIKQSFSRRPAVKSRLGGVSTSSLYQYMQDGVFPRPVRIGLRAVAWLDHEVDAVIAARAAGKTPDEIKGIVAKLEAARKSAQ